MSHNLHIDKSWTLFLDRDGVINTEIKGDYVRNWDLFKFCENALDAFPLFNDLFGKIVIVTNQRGVEKNLMSIEDLSLIHQKMVSSIELNGGRIDRIYYCTALSDLDPDRKPNTGMAFSAKRDFPEIIFEKSVMVGNSLSDMEFGKKLSMYTCLVESEKTAKLSLKALVDYSGASLYEIAKILATHKMNP